VEEALGEHAELGSCSGGLGGLFMQVPEVGCHIQADETREMNIHDMLIKRLQSRFQSILSLLMGRRSSHGCDRS
jgi:hypothetical protein